MKTILQNIWITISLGFSLIYVVSRELLRSAGLLKPKFKAYYTTQERAYDE